MAFRVGQKCGARLRFIDLNYGDQVMAEHGGESQSASPRVESLLREHYLQRSAYLRTLANDAGCRDFNELWDHLFESALTASSTGTIYPRDRGLLFFRSPRYSVGTDEIGWHPEAVKTAMAAAIREEMKVIEGAGDNRPGRLVVVTGGPHTVALPDLVATIATKLPAPPERSVDATPAHLIRYSFDRLDALNGYAAGMPSPLYYHKLLDGCLCGRGQAIRRCDRGVDCGNRRSDAEQRTADRALHRG